MDEPDFEEITEHLFTMVKIVFEFTDVLQKLLSKGAEVDGNFLIFEYPDCNEVYAINPISRRILSLYTMLTPLRFGTDITDTDEIICLIERFVLFVTESLGHNFPEKEIFMQKFNPNNYQPGNCFSLS